MQTVISKLANKINLFSRWKWWHKTCEYIHFLTKPYLTPTCFTKLQVFLDFRCFLIASPRNYAVTLTLTGRSCKMSCQYPRINQSQVYCFVIKLMNTSSHNYKNSSSKHTTLKRGRIRRLIFNFLGQLNHLEAILHHQSFSLRLC